jgi:nucleoid-associated protein YgaU
VIAGRAVAGSEVIIKLNGQPIGSATSNQDGNFVVVPEQPLPAGTGALTLEIKPAGTAAFMPAGETVAVAVPEDEQQQVMAAVLSQDQPTEVLQAPAAAPEPAVTETAAAQPEATAPSEALAAPAISLSLDAVDYDNQGNIMFSGRGAAGSNVRLYVDNAPVGESQSGTDGRWSFVGAAQIAPGNHTLRVDEIDAAGAVANRVELPFFREEAAKVAAAEPVAQPEALAPAPESPATEPEVAAAAAPDEQPKLGRVVIQPGNNLWRISQVIYGSGVKYTVIYEANREFIRNPDLIYPGQIFKTPEVVPPEKIDPRRRAPLAPGESEAAAQ